jgi:hypothetical protein
MNVEFEPISAAQWKTLCSGLERRSDVQQCLDDSVGEPRFSVGPSEEVVIEAEPSNIFPKTFRALRRQ